MKKSIIPLLAVLFFGCSNDFSDSSIDVLRPEKEDSVERVDKSWVLIFSDEFNIDGAVVDSQGRGCSCLLVEAEWYSRCLV